MSHGTEEHLEHAHHAQHAAHDPFDRRVAMTMAIIAAVLALVTMLSHREHTETLRLQTEANIYQTKASDQWGYYQSKKNRQYLYEAQANELPLLAKDASNSQAAAQADKIAKKWKQQVATYAQDTKKINEEARGLEEEAKKAQEESHHAHKRADRFDFGELGVELALVLCSIAVLTKNTHFWISGTVIGCVGLGVALSAFMLH